MSERRSHEAAAPRAGLPAHLWLALGVFALSLFLQLHVRTEVIRLGYALEQERSIGEELRAEHARLALEQTVVGAGDRLAKRATELGMRLSTPADVESVHIARGER